MHYQNSFTDESLAWENQASTRTQGMPLTLGVAGDPRIIDLTAQADKSKRYRIRDPRQVYALVLHQMACCYRVSDPRTRYLKMASHFVIQPDGKIFQLHPIQALTAASNGFNPGSVAVEFAGNFPNTQGKWWVDREDVEQIRTRLQKQRVPAAQIEARVQAFIRANQNRVTPQQIEAGRYLVSYLIRTLQNARGLTHILAHRQSSGSRENDPGPDIWFHVGQWAVEKLGLKDGGPGFKIHSGNPIPDAWRNWGRVARQQEREWESETDRHSPEYIRWVQQSLNRILGTRLVVDGNLGTQTLSAIRSFQQQAGLAMDGIVGTRTEAALQDAGAPSPPSGPSPVPEPLGPPDIVSVRGIQVARSIAPQVESLLDAAEADGVQLSGWGYRSTERQIELRRKNCGTSHYDIWDKPSSQCTPPTATPGKSMHEKGLAIDFTYNSQSIKSHDNPGFQWLARNASRFGLQNLPSEPWHWSVNGR